MKFELLPILIIAEVDSSYAHYLVVCLGGNDYGPERVNVLSVVFIPEHRNSRNYFQYWLGNSFRSISPLRSLLMTPSPVMVGQGGTGRRWSL